MATNTRKGQSSTTSGDKHAIIGKKPNKVIAVPHEFRRHMWTRERDALVHDIKISTGCDICIHLDQSVISQFELFGSGASLEKAVRHINQWITKAPTKSKDSAAWAKMPAFDPDTWYYNQVEAMEAERKQQFKGPIPTTVEGKTQLPKVS